MSMTSMFLKPIIARSLSSSQPNPPAPGITQFQYFENNSFVVVFLTDHQNFAIVHQEVENVRRWSEVLGIKWPTAAEYFAQV